MKLLTYEDVIRFHFLEENRQTTDLKSFHCSAKDVWQFIENKVKNLWNKVSIVTFSQIWIEKMILNFKDKFRSFVKRAKGQRNSDI